MKVVRSQDLDFIAASHEDPENPGVLKKVLATKTDLQAGQVQMLNWSWLKAGKSFEKHYHEDMQEVFVIVSGTARMLAGGEEATLKSGDVAIVAPREIHQMTCVGDEDVTYVVFGIASGHGGRTVRVT